MFSGFACLAIDDYQLKLLSSYSFSWTTVDPHSEPHFQSAFDKSRSQWNLFSNVIDVDICGVPVAKM